MLTGIGGGMVRDMLLAEVPTVLRADIYATAALAGAAVVVSGHSLRLPAVALAIAGAVCVAPSSLVFQSFPMLLLQIGLCDRRKSRAATNRDFTRPSATLPMTSFATVPR